MVAEFLDEEIDEAAAVFAFLGGHFGEDGGGGGIFIAHAVDEIGVDTAVFLLGADGEGEDFAFGEFVEIAHGDLRGLLVSL